MNNLEEIKLVNGIYEYTFKHISDVSGFDYSTTRLSIEDLAGDQSAEYITSKFGRRRLSWKSVLMEDKIDTIVDMQRALRQGNLKTIYFNPYPRMELQAEIEIDRFSMPYKNGRRVMLIEAIAPDWRFYSQIEGKFTLTPTVITGGMDIPAEVPFNIYNNVNFFNNLQNIGDQETDPTFIINGPGSRFPIRNNTTGEEFAIEYTLAEGDTVVISKKDGTVILNDIHDIFSSKVGEIWSLAPGSNVITFNPVSASDDTLLTIKWRPAFGGF